MRPFSLQSFGRWVCEVTRPAIFIADASNAARMNKRSGERKPDSRYTEGWQEDRAVAAGSPCASGGCRERKVRTPQGSVPDNVRDAGFKARGRLVPQKTYRLCNSPSGGVRVSQWTRPKVCPPRSGKGEKVR